MIKLNWWQWLLAAAVGAGLLYLGHRYADLAAIFLPAGGAILLAVTAAFRNSGPPPAPPAPGAAVLLLLALGLGLSACSPGDDQRDQAVSEQALVTGQSAPPAGGWASVGPQGWLCAPSSWDPFGNVAGSAAWPAHGWCQWSPASGYLPWRVRSCATYPTPPFPGTMLVYTGENYTGSCAVLFGDDVHANGTNGGYLFNSDLVQVSGWYDKWTDSGGPHEIRVRSFKAAAHTHVVISNSAATNAPGLNFEGIVGAGLLWSDTGGSEFDMPSLDSIPGVVPPWITATIKLGYWP